MRVIGSVIFLTLAVQPASSSEAFIPQVSKVITAEQVTAASTKSIASSESLALPVKLNAVGSSAQPAALPGVNASLLLQSGTNNFAAASQAGGGNASTILQHGNGNQATVTQRNH